MELALAGLLAAWLLVTVLCQFPSRLADGIRRLDYLGAIPSWTFFSPNPLQHNIVLCYRDALADGTLTPWRNALPAEPSGMQRVLRNPNRRARKALIDLTQQLLSERPHYREDDDVQLSVPYLMWLSEVQQLTHARDAVATQFVLLATNRQAGQDPVVLRSPLHPLETPCPA